MSGGYTIGGFGATAPSSTLNPSNTLSKLEMDQAQWSEPAQQKPADRAVTPEMPASPSLLNPAPLWSTLEMDPGKWTTPAQQTPVEAQVPAVAPEPTAQTSEVKGFQGLVQEMLAMRSKFRTERPSDYAQELNEEVKAIRKKVEAGEFQPKFAG